MITELATRLAAFVGLCALIFWPLELLWARRRPRVTPRAWLVDLGWLTLGAFTLHTVVGPVLRALSVPPATSVRPARIALALVLAELGAWAMHRAMHGVPTLRRFHAVHHEVRELDWLKTWRQHPLDVALHAVVVGLPGVLLGVPFSALGTFVFLRRLWGVFLHANVDVRLGWLEHVVTTPRFHHTHHQRGASNYAGLFPWIDSIFGTRASIGECRALLPRRGGP